MKFSRDMVSAARPSRTRARTDGRPSCILLHRRRGWAPRSQPPGCSGCNYGQSVETKTSINEREMPSRITRDLNDVTRNDGETKVTSFEARCGATVLVEMTRQSRTGETRCLCIHRQCISLHSACVTRPIHYTIWGVRIEVELLNANWWSN